MGILNVLAVPKYTKAGLIKEPLTPQAILLNKNILRHVKQPKGSICSMLTLVFKKNTP